ncbi:type IX secretion system plug protein [Halocola ammonii]
MTLNNNLKPFKSECFKLPSLLFFALFFTLFSCGSLEPSTQANSSSNDDTDYVSESQSIRFQDWVYVDNIRTDQLYGKGNPLSSPYFELGTPGGVELSFDDMDADFKNYYYTVIHCDANWYETDMLPSRYLRGFREAPIEDFEYSFNTYEEYTNYKLVFPNQEMGVNVSGNYLLVVYPQGQREKPVLTKRFVVYERLVDIGANVKQPTVVSERKYQQEVDFTVYHKDYPINNPYTELSACVLQNNRWDNAVMNLQPKFVKQQELVYDYDVETTFDGGNEFREFDLKNLRYSTIQVDSIRIIDGEYHAYLLPDPVRRWSPYRSKADINGRFLVKNDMGTSDRAEAHYVNVHFTLPYETNVPKTDFYIFGGLSNFNYRKEFRMKYDHQEKAYKATLLLKQGYYNYQYIMLSEGENYGDLRPAEGSHYQAQNEYTIFLYNKEMALDYDRVVGAAFIDAFEN